MLLLFHLLKMQKKKTSPAQNCSKSLASYNIFRGIISCTDENMLHTKVCKLLPVTYSASYQKCSCMSNYFSQLNLSFRRYTCSKSFRSFQIFHSTFFKKLYRPDFSTFSKSKCGLTAYHLI